jgi:hypothetical protein
MRSDPRSSYRLLGVCTLYAQGVTEGAGAGVRFARLETTIACAGATARGGGGTKQMGYASIINLRGDERRAPTSTWSRRCQGWGDYVHPPPLQRRVADPDLVKNFLRR